MDKTKVEKSEAKATELEKKVGVRERTIGSIILFLRFIIFLTCETQLRCFESIPQTTTISYGKLAGSECDHEELVSVTLHSSWTPGQDGKDRQH